MFCFINICLLKLMLLNEIIYGIVLVIKNILVFCIYLFLSFISRGFSLFLLMILVFLGLNVVNVFLIMFLGLVLCMFFENSVINMVKLIVLVVFFNMFLMYLFFWGLFRELNIFVRFLVLMILFWFWLIILKVFLNLWICVWLNIVNMLEVVCWIFFFDLFFFDFVFFDDILIVWES